MKGLQEITERLKLLGDSTRLRVLNLLVREELSVGELSTVLGQGQSTISSHLGRLREAGLVQDRRDGTRSFHRMEPSLLDEAGRRIWELLVQGLEEDPLLGADRERMEQVVLARASGSWVDRAAGTLDRRYVPGRSFETVAVALSHLMELGHCVDMGSGDGALLDLFAPASESLTCLDLHPRMVEAGCRRIREAGHANVSFLQGDMMDPPLDEGSFDSVLFMQSLQYARDPAAALKAAGRLLRPEGRCLVLTLGEHGDLGLQREYGHLHPGFKPERLEAWFEEAGLRVLACRPEGYDRRSPQLPILLGLARKGD